MHYRATGADILVQKKIFGRDKGRLAGVAKNLFVRLN
jgi:hypothetical protein